ncbi:MAG: BatA and WFA domain-containing protein [Candidatus Cloacimonadales bacterium]
MFNLTFLNSGILLFALAGLLPILIYLFAKKKPRTIIFSSLRFIKASSQQKKQKMNLKNLLLLLIRILIILLTILAIARPALKLSWLQSDSEHPPTAFALIIDNSYSMDFLIDTNTALEQAQQYLATINSKISGDDISLLLTLDRDWNQIYANLNYGKIPSEYFSQISLTANPIKLQEAIEIAEAELAQSDLLNREIIILSDLQKRDLPSEISTNTFFIPLHQAEHLGNVSLQNSSFSHNLIARKLQNNISFQLVNHSQLAQNDLVCRLFLDGNSVAEKVLSLQPGQTLAAKFQLQLNQAGWHSGFVEVINERLNFDNKNYFAFYHNPSPNLAIISNQKDLPLSLKSIAEIYADNYQIFSEFDYEQLQNFQAIICYNPPQFDPKAKFTLEKLAQEQGILFIADAALSTDWQDFLAEKFALKFEQYYDKPGQNIALSSHQKFHPITAEIRLRNDSTLNDFWLTKSAQNILLEAEDYPLILTAGKSLFWSFDPASKKNPFLLEAAFPIIAYNSLLYTEQETYFRSYQTGDLLKTDSPLTLPNGEQVSKNVFTAREAGVYRTENQRFAVNIPYEESTYEPLAYAGDIIFLEDDDWQDKIIASRYGYEIWKHLLALVFLLFMMEMLIVKLSERKAS